MQRFLSIKEGLCLIRNGVLCAPRIRLFSATTLCERVGGASKLETPVKRSFVPVIRHIPTIHQIENGLELKLRKFSHNPEMRRKAAAFGIRGELFNTIADNFVKAALAGQIPRCKAQEIFNSMTEEDGMVHVDKVILNSFYSYAEPFLPEETVNKFSSLRKISDLRFPSEWFPEARQMQRKIILHVGPTNSGKTYRALQRLEEAESGIYCGPLRLLAHEIFEKMNEKGIPCNLLTGEERKEVAPHARLTSSTVEMASLNKTLDVAVIDEIQMIADPDRGWAWTQALLGLKAKEIHLCGEEAAVPLIKKICETLDEEVVVNEYARLTPYTVLDKSLYGDLSNIKKGDCVVAFSRKAIFELKKKIEKETGLKCAVAYGALPPETRALQAKAFNDPDSGFDVLVASDAIGMGLNLNIKRIVFSEVTKFDGKVKRFISIPQLKQIAGRAGRFGTTYAKGEVTTLRPGDLRFVKKSVIEPNAPLEMAGLQPTVDILELFALQSPNEPFSRLLQKFEDLSLVSGNYFLCNYNVQKKIADRIESIKIPVRDRYQFVTAPVNTRNEQALDMIEILARKFSDNEPCQLDDIITMPADPSNDDYLTDLEVNHKHIMLYMWLSIRYPEVFVTDQDHASQIKLRCEVLIDEKLKSASLSTAFKSHSKKKFQKGKRISSF